MNKTVFTWCRKILIILKMLARNVKLTFKGGGITKTIINLKTFAK
jgi:hypothetical protein